MARSKLFLLILLLIPAGVWMGLHYLSAPTSPSVGINYPGHPAFEADWWKMKNTDGRIDYQIIQNYRLQAGKGRRGNTLLENIQELGPSNVGGRTRALMVDQTNPHRWLAGAISGGIWASENDGNSWAAVNDQEMNLSVTGIVQNPLHPAIIYYCTGEGAGNSASVTGAGIFKSTDTGKTFFQLPATAGDEFKTTWRIACSAVDSHTLYVATHSNGLMRSIDDGASFHPVLASGKVQDIEVFQDSSVLITVHGAGVFLSDNGDSGTFTQLTGGLPVNGLNRIEVAYCREFDSIWYAQFENSSGDNLLDIYRSNDRGQSWTVLNSPADPGGADIGYSFPWYCFCLAVKPDDPDYIVSGASRCGFSRNGGQTWQELENSHADYHTILFNPHDLNQIIIGNDGGIYSYATADPTLISTDLNQGYNVTQFYAGAAFPFEKFMYGGTQDNGTQSRYMASNEFAHINGGDGGYTTIDQFIPDIAYVSYQRGIIRRTSDAQSAKPTFTTILNELDGDNNGSVDEGTWFINPFYMNDATSDQLYFVTLKKIWRSNSSGEIWQPLTNSLDQPFNVDPFAVGISYDPNPVVYIGGDNGLFYRVSNAATAVPGDEVDLRNSVPTEVKNDFLRCLTVHPKDASIVYVGLSNVDTNSRIYKVINATTSPQWVDISGDLPKGLPVNWVEVSYADDNVILAGTDFGLYISSDGGNTWTKESGIPNVVIFQMKLRRQDGRLFVFTHGRGAWTAQLPGEFMGHVSTEPAEQPLQLRIGPNPAGDNLHLTFAGRERSVYAEVIATDGKLVWDGWVNSTLDVSDLSKGMYLLRVTDGNEKCIKRFFKL